MLKTETRALILGDVLARANNPLRTQPNDLADPARMTDAAIEADHTDLTARVANITRQLDDDREMNCSRGDAWRKRAMGARRVHLAQIDRLVIEARRRGLAFVRAVGATLDGPPPVRGLDGSALPDAERYRALERRQQARDRQAAAEAAAAARKEEARRAEAERAAAKAAAFLELTRVRAERHAVDMQARAARLSAITDRDRRQERCFIDAAKELLGQDACGEIWARAKVLFPDAAWEG